MEDKPFLDLGRAHRVKGRGLSIPISLMERLRAARGIKQAVVKVASYAHGKARVLALVDYISRKGKRELETESGERIKDREQGKALVDNWARDFDGRLKSRDAVHVVFSMPPGSSVDALRESVRKVGARAFPDREWVFGIHEDRKHPHAHMAVKMRGKEKDKKLRLNKPELYQLREVFAEAAREQGVELAASSRAARGVGRKGTRQAIYQLRLKGIRPEVVKRTVEEAIQELKKGDWKEKPWEKAMSERNQLEREAYRLQAAALRQEAEKQTQQADRERMLRDAEALEQFARSMPKPKTRRQAAKEWMWQKVQEKRKEKSRAKERDNGLER